MPDGSGNAFMFRPAVRENTPMVMALAGASGSGKTFTALELAMGLADGGKVAVIDTEGRRALHYADLRDQHTGEVLFRFDHCELRPPFSPDRFLDAMKAAEGAGYRVIVIDSFSDEHEGEGGLIDMAAAGNSQNSAANWARPKAAHKLVVRWLRQTRCHVIFCLRAEERVRLEKDDKGKTVVVPVGWVPICEKRFMYDMTASFLLSPERPGIPEPIKLQEQHRRFFPKGAVVTRDSGRQLAAWATGGTSLPHPHRSIEDELREAAARGKAALQAAWSGLGRDERRPYGYLIGTKDAPGELTLLAKAADEGGEPPDDIPFDEPASEIRPGDVPDANASVAPQPHRQGEPHSPAGQPERNRDPGGPAPQPAGEPDLLGQAEAVDVGPQQAAAPEPRIAKRIRDELAAATTPAEVLNIRMQHSKSLERLSSDEYTPIVEAIERRRREVMA